MDAVANIVQQGQPTASGTTSITVEKHKNNFHTQYGTFEDKAAQNIVRWLRKADKYQNAHMVPSLEMAAIVIHCIRGEPAIKVKRWLDVPGVTHINADHYNAQPVQIAVEYQPYQELIEAVPGTPAVPAVPEQAFVPAVEEDLAAVPPQHARPEIPFQAAVPAVPEVPAVARRAARPAILPRRYQPAVQANQCLKHYLTTTYQKRINLSEADKFLTTFKNQKPRQTCSNFLDEFIINYENYAHMKWTIEQIDGVLEVQGVVENLNANPPQIGVQAVAPVQGNHLIRNAEMIQLATDGLCKEFKIHCDNTAINLNTITFPNLEIEVQKWQRNTETGKTFTMSCTPANAGKHANVSALEMSDYFNTKMDTMEQALVSATTMSNRGQRGTRGNRGYGRGGRGFRGRGQGAGRQPPKPSIQSKDSQDGGFNNYRQTQDGTVMVSPQGHPLCNYCGIPSHKRELCMKKKADRDAGLTRTIHPDRDNPKPKIFKATPNKTTAEATISAATHPMPWPGQVYTNYPIIPSNYTHPQQNYPIVPMNYTHPQPNDSWQQAQRGPNIQALVHSARLEHEQASQGHSTYDPPNTLQSTTTPIADIGNPNPCPYPTCSAILQDPQMTQEHIRMFHKQSNNLTMKSGNNP